MSADVNEAKASQGRRNFLKIIGGGVIVAASAGGLFAASRTPTKAIEPWKLALGAKPDFDPRRYVLSHAILAPNPHNRQPWQVDLEEENVMTLYCDLDRRLPYTDPFDRQITIGLGCFLELADIAAKEIGLKAEIEMFPAGEGVPRLDDRPVARIELKKDDVEPDPLFAHIYDRRSNKDPYELGKSVSAENASLIVAEVVGGAIGGDITDENVAAELRKIAWNAMETELRTYRTAKESIDLLRIGKAEIEENPDGIDLGGAFFEVADALGFMNRDEFLDTSTTAFQQQMAAVKEPFGTANGFVFVKTEGNFRRDQIAAGRSYVRMNLKATELGIAMQPWSQALQEFEEVAPQYKQIRKVLQVEEGETLQMFARIGYGKKPEPSPRWAYETRLVNS
ncbi:MAG: nitroreductase family protein [Rhizobiaceae bacterium]|nr:nitroreductase family protein [Rhizobiaceae bacterium]